METNNLHTPELYQFKMNGKNIVLDVMTARVFSVDNIAYDVLTHAHNNTVDTVTSILSQTYSREDITATIDELKQAGLLQESAYEVRESPVKFQSERPLLIMDLILSQDCNMRCRYCFADTGKYKKNRTLMNIDVARSAIDFIIQRSGTHKELTVTFFGGEPSVNIPVLKQIIDYAEAKGPSVEKKFHFTISTNGTLLSEEFIRYLHNKKAIVQISIDGDEETQNRNRPYQGNKGSYADVKANAQNLFQITGDKITARATVISRDTDKYVANVQHLLSLGFHNVHMEAASGPKGKIFINKESDVKALMEQYDTMADLMLEKINTGQYFGFNNFIRVLKSCHINDKRFYPCGAGRGYLCVGEDGNIYPCHRFVGNDKYVMGNVVSNTYDPYWEKFITEELIVLNRESCRSCWTRFFCGGDCIGASEEKNGDIRIPDPIRCTLIKRSVELCLMIYAHITKDKKPDFEKIYNIRHKKHAPIIEKEQG
jgi:uncharacterized protein